jgi:catechol 2,3-dioxygenase-like lactoylglutathione lyase family enzyme
MEANDEPPIEGKPMRSEIESIVLRVTDLDAAIKFWQTVFGLELRNRSEGEDGAEATLKASIGGGAVTLVKPKGDDRPVEMGHSIFRQYMHTSDSARLFRHAVRLGYEDTHEPFDVIPSRFNVVKSYTRDPDGYLFDLCEFQGPPGKRMLHDQVDATDHSNGGSDIATYVGYTAIYVTAIAPAVDFWTRLGALVVDQMEVSRGYTAITQLRSGTGGVVVQLMETKAGFPAPPDTTHLDEKQAAAAARHAAVMPQPGKVDMGKGFQGFRITTDDCSGLYNEVVAGGFRSLREPTKVGSTIIAKVADPDGYAVEIRQAT